MEIYIFIALVIIIFIALIILNNRIITKRNQSDQAYSSIEIYLKKRFDLIPNLIALLNKYLSHEKELLLKITELRSQTNATSSPENQIESSNELTKLVSGLNVNLENYPELKADKQFSNIQHELTDIEEQLSASRRAYNAAVTEYNNQIQTFPASIVASVKNYKAQLLLEIPKEEQKEINIKSLLNNKVV